jgi:hypothetical protein
MSRTSRSVRLSAPQIAYLSNATFLPGRLREKVVNAVDSGAPGLITIDTAMADLLQSALTDRLGQAGFDTEYDVTDEGVMRRVAGRGCNRGESCRYCWQADAVCGCGRALA